MSCLMRWWSHAASSRINQAKIKREDRDRNISLQQRMSQWLIIYLAFYVPVCPGVLRKLQNITQI